MKRVASLSPRAGEPRSITPAPLSPLRVGVCGWDYPDWRGPIYPRRARAGFDPLAFLAEYLDLIEINASFYRPIDPRHSESWIRRIAAAPNFRFTAKAHRGWTHEPSSTLGDGVATTLAGLAPLRDAGRFGALLLQFPQRFVHHPRAIERLERLRDAAEGWPIVVEVRHASWACPEATDWFARERVSRCIVDQPDLPATLPLSASAVTPLVYVRLHGRNAANWFLPGVGRDARYDFCYSSDELDDLAARLAPLRPRAAEMFVTANNHFRGQAVVNALQLRRRLEGDCPRAPAAWVASFPQLAEDVRVESSGLF
jgi:uncharacterized protein YecE (DUF72 family)